MKKSALQNHWQIPSKTFLVGEYLALNGGPSLVLLTGPAFEFAEDQSVQGKAASWPKDSPADRLARRQDQGDDNKISFHDPHFGRGGFGASTAQFAAQFIKTSPAQLQPTEENVTSLLRLYRQCSGGGRAGRQAPSGSDLCAQLFGSSIALFQVCPFRLESLAWRFDEIGFYLIRTGFKVPTHEHLAQLQLELSDQWEQTVGEVVKALKEANTESFIAAVKQYRLLLESKGWVSETTQRLLGEIDQWSEIKVAKGCGALGADVLFIVYDQEHRWQVSQRIKALGVEIVASEKDLFAFSAIRGVQGEEVNP